MQQAQQLPAAMHAQPMGAPESLLLLEDMLISPRFDTHSPHFRPFPSFSSGSDVAQQNDDTSGKRDQNRCKPRFSTSSLPDVDW